MRARTCTRTSPSLAVFLAPSPSPSLQRHSLLTLSSPDPHPDQPRPSHWQRQRQRPGRCQHGVHLDAVRSARLDHRHLQTIPRARALRGAHMHMHMLMLTCTCMCVCASTHIRMHTTHMHMPTHIHGHTPTRLGRMPRRAYCDTGDRRHAARVGHDTRPGRAHASLLASAQPLPRTAQVPGACHAHTMHVPSTCAPWPRAPQIGCLSLALAVLLGRGIARSHRLLPRHYTYLPTYLPTYFTTQRLTHSPTYPHI